MSICDSLACRCSALFLLSGWERRATFRRSQYHVPPCCQLPLLAVVESLTPLTMHVNDTRLSVHVYLLSWTIWGIHRDEIHGQIIPQETSFRAHPSLRFPWPSQDQEQRLSGQRNLTSCNMQPKRLPELQANPLSKPGGHGNITSKPSSMRAALKCERSCASSLSDQQIMQPQLGFGYQATQPPSNELCDMPKSGDS